MFWDNVSGLYDLFETVYNGKVYRGLGRKVAEEIAPDDVVLECACGTGAISRYIAPKCKKLVATDFSVGMLKQTARKCRVCDNVRVRRADMTHLKGGGAGTGLQAGRQDYCAHLYQRIGGREWESGLPAGNDGRRF